jgi:(S)-3,5-dihydroxyphenylglycine transaminase
MGDPHGRMTSRAIFGDPLLDGMNFLNEAAERYPYAISLASGRPDLRAFRTFATGTGIVPDLLAAPDAERLLMYGATAGATLEIFRDWIAERMHAHVTERDVVVTTGCQEAMLVALFALFEPGRDVLLVSDPTYVGITGAAMLAGVEVRGAGRFTALDAARLDEEIGRVASQGKRARGLYLVPDHDNPTGESMDEERRRAILAAARAHDLIVLEDIAYRDLGFGAERLPSMLELGPDCVLQLGTFSKIAFPGLRIGYLAGPLLSAHPVGREAILAAKSFTTLNTATPTQYWVRTLLDRHREGFLESIAASRATYRKKRDVVLQTFAEHGLASMGVRWNEPTGGFFLTLRLPFAFGPEEMERCAGYGVLCTPMRLFALAVPAEREVRLAYSGPSPEQLHAGCAAFARFVAAELGEAQRSSRTRAENSRNEGASNSSRSGVSG